MRNTVLLFLLICIALSSCQANGKSEYIEKSIEELNAKSDEEISSMAKGAILEMEDGGKIRVIMNHECCSGDGFSCIVFMNSNKEIFIDEDHNFCGIEDLYGKLISLNAKDEDSFIIDTKKIGITARRYRN